MNRGTFAMYRAYSSPNFRKSLFSSILVAMSI